MGRKKLGGDFGGGGGVGVEELKRNKWAVVLCIKVLHSMAAFLSCSFG